MTLSYNETCVDALNSIIGVNFNKTDFNEAIKEKSAMLIPLYMVRKQWAVQLLKKSNLHQNNKRS